MKRGDTIKIVDSKPWRGQSDISDLIGRTYPVIRVHRDESPRGQISVKTSDGEIVLQREEYELEEKKV